MERRPFAARLHPEADMAYLEERVRYETTGDFGASDVE